MIDGISRIVLLVLLVIVSIRGLRLLPTTRRMARRWALYAMMPAQVLLIWFYVDNLLTRAFVRPVPNFNNLLLRAGIFMVIVGWFVKQEVITMSERAEATVNLDGP